MKNQKMGAVLGISLLLIAMIVTLFTLISEGDDSENSTVDTTSQPTQTAYSTPSVSGKPIAYPKLSAPLAEFYQNWLANPLRAQTWADDNHFFVFEFQHHPETDSSLLKVYVLFNESVQRDTFEIEVVGLGGRLGMSGIDKSGMIVYIPVDNLLILSNLPYIDSIYIQQKPIEFESFNTPPNIARLSRAIIVQTTLLCQMRQCEFFLGKRWLPQKFPPLAV